ncbi:hypothetical protein JC200_11015 [Alicyclobacillus sp. ALC3]|nr:hypothetical protein JC200_11015 [Alicyclobacillus sp. ALC3]
MRLLLVGLHRPRAHRLQDEQVPGFALPLQLGNGLLRDVEFISQFVKSARVQSKHRIPKADKAEVSVEIVRHRLIGEYRIGHPRECSVALPG